MSNERLDLLLVKQGLARSRANANELVKNGFVAIGGKQVTKPSQLVEADSQITVASSKGEELVSRAGAKLELAISALRSSGFEVNIADQNCLDIGASTGGFSQVLLENGAKKVIALDVGHGQLRAELRANPKVTVLERVNARYLTLEQLPFQPTFITCDVSFISLTMIFPAIRAVAAPNAQVLLLIKPQFEVGKGNLGKGGIVRNHKLVDQVIDEVTKKADENGIMKIQVIPSQVPGTNGNQEYFLFGQV